MKRVLVFFIAVMLMTFALAGCKIPFIGELAGPSDIAEDGDMVRLDDMKDIAGTDAAEGSASDSLAGNNGIAGNAGTAGNTADGPTADSLAGQPGYGNGANISGGTADSSNGGSADSLYSEDGTGTVGAVNTAGGVIDQRPAKEPSLEDASSSTAGYGSEPGGDGTAPATGVLAAASSRLGSTFAEPRRPVTVYYQDKDGCVIPMTRWIQPQLGIARAAVSLAIDSPLTREETTYYGVYPILPEYTEILGIDIRDGIATIDFNKYLLNYGTAYSERNIVASIVYTLTEFDTIQKVMIMVNGYPLGILKYGADLSEPLGREDVMINADPRLLTAGKEKLDVYFMKTANAGFTYPVPVSVTDSEGGIGVMPETLVKQLLHAVPAGGMYSEMPEGVSLIGSYVQGGVITLDFSEEFLSYGGTAREESILKQLAYTLRQCGSIRKINILVEGRRVELPEGTNISAGLAIPVTINDVMDR